MKKIITLVLVGGLLAALSSCSGKKRKPSVVFMPDMYYSKAYEPYSSADLAYPDDLETEVNLFEQHKTATALWPAEHTVPRNQWGYLPYDLENTVEAYNESKTITSSPLNPVYKEKHLERGEKLYGQVCAACHGAAGDGQGSIVQTGAYSGVPNYKDRQISVGSIYHVIMYGRNAMGSYAPQLNEADRWMVAEYVMELKNKN